MYLAIPATFLWPHHLKAPAHQPGLGLRVRFKLGCRLMIIDLDFFALVRFSVRRGQWINGWIRSQSNSEDALAESTSLQSKSTFFFQYSGHINKVHPPPHWSSSSALHLHPAHMPSLVSADDCTTTQGYAQTRDTIARRWQTSTAS